MGKWILSTPLFTLTFAYAQELREHTGLGCFKIKNKTYTHKKLKEEIKKANIIHNTSGEAYTDWMRKWKEVHIGKSFDPNKAWRRMMYGSDAVPE